MGDGLGKARVRGMVLDMEMPQMPRTRLPTQTTRLYSRSLFTKAPSSGLKWGAPETAPETPKTAPL